MRLKRCTMCGADISDYDAADTICVFCEKRRETEHQAGQGNK